MEESPVFSLMIIRALLIISCVPFTRKVRVGDVWLMSRFTSMLAFDWSWIIRMVSPPRPITIPENMMT